MSTHIYDPIYPSVIKSGKPAHHAIRAGLVRAAVGCALGTLIIAAPAPALAQTQDEAPTPQARVSEVEEQAAPSPFEATAPAEDGARENIDASPSSQAATTLETQGESSVPEGRGFSADESEEAASADAAEGIAPADSATSAVESNVVEAAAQANPAPRGPSDPSLDEVTALINDSTPEVDEVIDYGIGHSFTITGTDKDSGERYSTKRSSLATTQAILNTDKASHQLEAILILENHTDATKKVREEVLMPSFNHPDDPQVDNRIQMTLDPSRIGLDGLTCNVSSATFIYRILGDYYSASYWHKADPAFSWTQITAFIIDMEIAPGQKAIINIPLVIGNFDQIKGQVDHLDDGTLATAIVNDPTLRSATLAEYPYVWDAPKPYGNPTQVQLRLAKPNVNTMNAIDNVVCGDQHWLPSIMVKDTATGRKYELAPEEAMQTLPPLSSSDFTFYNYQMPDVHNTFYTDGFFHIRLENAFNAIKNLGYSVNIEINKAGTVQNIWPYYSYSTISRGKWDIPSNPNDSNDQRNSLGDTETVYLEVQPIFRTRDLDLDYGDVWHPDDSLISALVRFEAMDSMHVTGEDHLYKNGTYDFRLYNKDGTLVAHGDGNEFHACNGSCELNDGHKNQGESLTLKPGTYRVVYHYTIDPEHVITKTASITMGGPEDPAPQKIKPEPSTPVVQAIETDPQAPVQQVSATSEHVIPTTGDTNAAATAGIFGALGAFVTAAIAFVSRKGQRE